MKRMIHFRVNITYIDKSGERIHVKGKVGDNVMYLAHRHGIEIEGLNFLYSKDYFLWERCINFTLLPFKTSLELNLCLLYERRNKHFCSFFLVFFCLFCFFWKRERKKNERNKEKTQTIQILVKFKTKEICCENVCSIFILGLSHFNNTFAICLYNNRFRFSSKYLCLSPVFSLLFAFLACFVPRKKTG